MNNDNEQPYVPQAGDTIRHEVWAPGDTALITAVGRTHMLLSRNGAPDREAWQIRNHWIKVETPLPLPEQWSNVYPDGFWQSHTTAMSARVNSHDGRIAVLHIWTDADGVDHAEILRIKQ